MKQIGVGILGFGTVGAGVADGLLKHRDVMAKRLGVDIVLKKIADLDITTDRGIKVPDGVLTTDAKGVLADPEIDIIVETIGGTGIAKTFVLEALNGGKCVVMSRSAIFFKTMSTPRRFAMTSRCFRRPSATPAPTVPKPRIPTPICFMSTLFLFQSLTLVVNP